MNEDYFIEPVATSFQEDGAAQPHRIYKRQVSEHGAEQDSRPPASRETCGVQGIVPFILHFAMSWYQLGPTVCTKHIVERGREQVQALVRCVASADSLVLKRGIQLLPRSPSIHQRHGLPLD